ncbi:unnamed protein product [Bursaphelenchus xylophilus]|uniref:(pine wood nematode) hypothetical protein n=1 Tax=Bursaphelenchus xylophilus TaxID=6326 RepID=A0A1I7RLJ7_BURXY|nr:unnamed protein product [Bursaphelenchus xylophilus]CAG9082911.1 unnamed protein product [Bursaphelenchus xylophilus]
MPISVCPEGPELYDTLRLTFGRSGTSSFPFSSTIWTCPLIHPPLSGALVHLGDREDHQSRTKRVCMGFEPLILVHYCRPP